MKTTFETFRKFGDYELQTLTTKEPFCFNGEVGIRKFKITIELIDEPKEVLISRLEELWKKCDNHHHWIPLRNEAKKLGIELKSRSQLR